MKHKILGRQQVTPKTSGLNRLTGVACCLFMLLLFFSCHSSQPTGFCGVGHEYNGPSQPSTIPTIRTFGWMDTTAAQMITEVFSRSWPDTQKVAPAIGVTVKIMSQSKPGTVQYGITNAKGKFQSFLPAGSYQLQFTYTGCPPITKDSLVMASGEIKYIKVILGLKRYDD